MAEDSTASSPAPNRRRSGRVVAKPATYQDDPDITTNGSAKRKRAQRAAEDDDDLDDLDDSDADKPKKGKSKARKPANKKPKTTELAMRPATNGTRTAPRARKSKAQVSGVDDGSLYAQVFISGKSTEEVAQKWLEGYNNDNTGGLCQLVNFVLRSTGCELTIDEHDVEDPDNAPNRLTDLQDEYQAQKITEYPLIHKAKGNPFSQRQLESFFHSLIDTIHQTGTLYDDQPLYANIENWIVPMTSSPNRPFRHTATVITNALISAFCAVMQDIDRDLGMTTRAKQQEEKNKKKAKDKLASYQTKLEQLETRKADVDKWIRELFDGSFIHRYRDIDPKIRVECAESLGSWMQECPDIFFEASYLRYLGWLMSDQNHLVRGQVIAQFQVLYGAQNPEVGRLRAFTQRFRDRMVEIATRDSEVSIRVLAVDLVDSVRDLGLLEAEHIDTIGKLIFDAEPKVRKAVAPFFAHNVQDAYENITEALGGAEGLEDAVGSPDEEDFDSPRPVWLKYKSIAQLLDEYDQEDDTPEDVEIDALTPIKTAASRYKSAAEVVYDGIEEVKDDWPMLAGYLLFDTTTKQASRKRKSQDPLELFKQRCDLTESQERLLLEVLVTTIEQEHENAAELRGDKKAKKNKANADKLAKAEAHAQNVVAYLPRLLHKYASDPGATAIALRMARNISFEDLAEDSAEYESLLDDIGKQFLAHHDPAVLEEASSALLYALKHEELEDATVPKIQELWDKVSAALRQNARAKNPHHSSTAGNVLKLVKLADISDPQEAFTKTNAKSKDGSGSLLALLIGLIETYNMTQNSDAGALVVRCATAISKYYMWTVGAYQQQLATSPDAAVLSILLRQRFSEALTSFISEQPKSDKSRLLAINILLDTHTIFATLRNISIDDTDSAAAISELITEIPSAAQDLILSSFTCLEKQFAKKSGKVLAEIVEDDIDEAPESDDEQDDEEDLDEETQTQRETQRQHERLLIERALCELTGKIVLAILAKMLDASGSKKGSMQKRITQNKTKLGANFKEVLSYLDGPKAKRSKAKAAPQAPAAKTSAVVPDEDEEEEDEIEEVEEGGEEDLRRRELLTEVPGDEIEDDEVENGDEIEDEDDVMGD